MPPLLADIGGVVVQIETPTDVRPLLAPALSGPVVPGGGTPPAICYRITAEEPGRYGLERDGGGLLRNAAPATVAQSLIADLSLLLGQHLPEAVVVRAGVVGLGDRAVVVVGPEGTGTSTLVAALVEAGASLYADGLAVFDAQGFVYPVAVGGAGDSSVSAPPPLPVALVVATPFEPGAEWCPEAVTGTRAALGLLAHLLSGRVTSPNARALASRLAGHVMGLRGHRPEAATVAADVLDRAGQVLVADVAASAVEHGNHLTGPRPEAGSVRFVQFDDFLDQDQHERLLAFALSSQADFVPSNVTPAEQAEGGAYPDFRRSLTLYDLDDVWTMFEEALVGLLAHVRTELGVSWFQLGEIERQLTVHGDGDHFTLHVDNTSADTAQREISAVYYFNREPRRFSGGELWLFDTVEANGVVTPVESHTEIVPRDNSLVFFPSSAYHEVRPVHSESTAFEDRRFTIVFWARRASPVAAVFRGDPDTITARQSQLLPSLTADGFRVVPTPPPVQARLQRLFADGLATARPEDSDENYLPSGDPRLIATGDAGGAILDELQGLHEEWCGKQLAPRAADGIRVYGEGQTLRPHCDRVETHVISSILHVAADVDEPWPLVIEDAEGRGHEVYLEPGEMLLYESAKLPHSRPTPLHGRYYASLFLHYTPVDWEATLRDVCQKAAADGRLGVGALG